MTMPKGWKPPKDDKNNNSNTNNLRKDCKTIRRNFSTNTNSDSKGAVIMLSVIIDIIIGFC